MIAQKKKKIGFGRRVILLSATFLLLFAVSCKKKQNGLGESVLPDGTTLSSAGNDTFSIRTYSYLEDSVPTKNPLYNLIGIYNDQYVGTVEANFYTQISLSGFSPDFGDFNDIKIDSCVAAFIYSGYYGTPKEMLFEVYELDEDIDEDSSYYQFSTIPLKANNLVPTANNEGLIKPRPLKSNVVGNDTVAPQLRIPLDTVFGRDLLQIAANSPSNETFLEDVKGLFFRVNSPQPSMGQGAIVYLESTNPSSKVTVYYTVDDTLNLSFDFLISSSFHNFNHVDLDMSMTPLEGVVNDTIQGQSSYFMHALNARAKIEFPSLKDIPETAAILEARLELPVAYFAGSDFYPSATITVGSKFYDKNGDVFLVSGQDNLPYNAQLRAYVINLKEYVQRVVAKQYINDGIIISPRLFNTSVERTVLNGMETNNKNKPKLRILYTEF